MKEIFVFGSNTGGIHGGGAAAHAHDKLNAQWGVGYGHTGATFALPTKGVVFVGESIRIGDPLPLASIMAYVAGFLTYAEERPDLTFKVTRIGCGLAGFTDEQIAPLFAGAPKNCTFDTAWKDELGDEYTYWGHVG